MSRKLEEVNEEAQRALIRQQWRRTIAVAFWGMVLARGDTLAAEELKEPGSPSVVTISGPVVQARRLAPAWETSTLQYCAGTFHAILNGRETWA